MSERRIIEEGEKHGHTFVWFEEEDGAIGLLKDGEPHPYEVMEISDLDGNLEERVFYPKPPPSPSPMRMEEGRVMKSYNVSEIKKEDISKYSWPEYEEYCERQNAAFVIARQQIYMPEFFEIYLGTGMNREMYYRTRCPNCRFCILLGKSSDCIGWHGEEIYEYKCSLPGPTMILYSESPLWDCRSFREKERR